MTREEMLADLAYARTLAEEGRHAPLLGGAHLTFWGVMNAGAFSVQWSILEGWLPLAGGAAFALLWLSYGIIGAIGSIWLRQRTRTKPGQTAIGARAEKALWSGAALALLAIVFGSLARMIFTGDTTAPNAIFGPAFAIYGAMLIGTASLSEQSWMRGFGLASVAVGAILCLFASESWAYLLAAGGSLAVLALPGIILLRREPSAVV
ncbi:hypothetical protein [Candidatus Viadribacter manganicus]|uniref:Uncharacterized protein n=1 Tax=Candidatus Viadribacter manganicus TaxID=1759059 RepID=A0A1B1AI60_9PROT|nr:hypothetical protein [Candidatus Viadribacter manganicus]ANP46210.1 hypothetical protein ATE48_09910 [Candidatus Viadribacter manganicus]